MKPVQVSEFSPTLRTPEARSPEDNPLILKGQPWAGLNFTLGRNKKSSNCYAKQTFKKPHEAAITSNKQQ